tara:strand:- start:7990 stop:8265 length:276 start_codon:yes stop_codon:yes gene_type:complete
MTRTHTGVTFNEEDRDNGPFKIRIGGTSDFVSEIDPDYKRCWPAGQVLVCEGWDSLKAVVYTTLDEALGAADQVWNIEGFHTSIEIINESR